MAGDPGGGHAGRARAASAHFIWITVEPAEEASQGGAKVQAFFSEPPVPEGPEFLKYVKDLKLVVDGQPIPAILGEETLEARWAGKLPAMIDAERDLGVTGRGGKTFRLIYTARAQTVGGPHRREGGRRQAARPARREGRQAPGPGPLRGQAGRQRPPQGLSRRGQARGVEGRRPGPRGDRGARRGEDGPLGEPCRREGRGAGRQALLRDPLLRHAHLPPEPGRAAPGDPATKAEDAKGAESSPRRRGRTTRPRRSRRGSP